MRAKAGIAVPDKFFANSFESAIDSGGIAIAIKRLALLFQAADKPNKTKNVASRRIMSCARDEPVDTFIRLMLTVTYLDRGKRLEHRPYRFWEVSDEHTIPSNLPPPRSVG